jgi:hypothetical protein
MANPSLPAFDGALAAAAFDSLKTALAALPAQELPQARPDVRPLVAAALAAHAEGLAHSERLARLPAQEFEQGCLARVEKAAWALWHARSKLDAALQPKESTLPAPLAEGAGALRDRMVRVARYYLEDDAQLGPQLAALGKKKPAELSAELRRLAAIFKEKHALLSTDKRHWKATDEAEALEVAGQIEAVLSETDAEAIAAWTLALSRAQALLVAEHEELRLALLWLLRKDPSAPERLPQLLAVPAPRGRPRKASGVPSEPPPARSKPAAAPEDGAQA